MNAGIIQTEAGAETSSLQGLSTATWLIEFSSGQSMLRCVHTGSGAVFEGVITFHPRIEKDTSGWRISTSRDSIRSRLALLDSHDEVQGYVIFTCDGNMLRIKPIHRSAQNYPGELRYEAVVQFGTESYACRTGTPANQRVVQLASGPADSLLNDSIFDIPSDTAVCVAGKSACISTRSNTGAFNVSMSAEIDEPDSSEMMIHIIKDYYRSQYVPYYKPRNKLRCPKAPTGWMSWNVYFDTAGEKENLAEARIAAQYLKPYGMDFFSIESWQDNSPELPVSVFHNLTLRPDPNKFPSGMKWLADQIRALGFRPGIWTVPFGTGDTAFYESHKDWFLHKPNGEPMQNWCGLYVLDPSQEAVRKHMEESHRIMSREWGYEYFKIDGMSGRGSSYCAHFYERDDVRAAFKEPVEDPFLLCVEALRRGIGDDRVFLACQGHYTGPDPAFADAGRIGADIVAHRCPPDWNNYMNQARATLNQLFVNNILWYGDPDTLLVGQANSLPTVRLAASVVALSGQAMFAGDKLAELPAERMRLLQQCLPVCDIRPLDLYPVYNMPPVWDVKIHRPYGIWDVISLFNWNNVDEDISVRISEFGLDTTAEYIAYDCWNRNLQRGIRDELHASVPAHGNALFAIHKNEGRPQLVYSDRHLVTGGIGLDSIAWDDTAGVLSGSVDLVNDDPTELAFDVPQGFHLQSISAGDGIVWSNATSPDGALYLTLRGSSSGTAHWSLAFQR